MTFRKCTLAGLPVILSRISFTGELAFEVSVRPWHVRTIWNDLLDAGSDLGIAPYGLEALHVLRAEKGYVIIGQETDGSVMPDDLGLARLAGKQGDFLGRRSLRRPDALRPDRRQLVGLLSDDPTGVLAEGGQITATAAGEPPVAMLGHVTSSYRSPFLGRSIALALVSAGRSRIGELVYVHSLGDVAPARVTEPVFVDPGNERRDG
jgi:sarcosine oxidase subunit alpha